MTRKKHFLTRTSGQPVMVYGFPTLLPAKNCGKVKVVKQATEDEGSREVMALVASAAKKMEAVRRAEAEGREPEAPSVTTPTVDIAALLARAGGADLFIG